MPSCNGPFPGGGAAHTPAQQPKKTSSIGSAASLELRPQIAALLSHLNLPEITWSSIVLHHFSSALLISTSHQHFSSALLISTSHQHFLHSAIIALTRRMSGFTVCNGQPLRRTWLATVLKYSHNDQSGLLTSTNPEIDWLGWFSWISIAVCHSLRVTHPYSSTGAINLCLTLASSSFI